MRQQALLERSLHANKRSRPDRVYNYIQSHRLTHKFTDHGCDGSGTLPDPDPVPEAENVSRSCVVSAHLRLAM